MFSSDPAYECKRRWDQEHGYSQQKECPHPLCDTIIRDKSMTCARHRAWRRYGGETGKLARHHRIEAMLDRGLSAEIVMALARRKLIT